jgi:hypothetical protein
MTEPRHAIDLTRHSFVRHLGDLSIYGSWIYNNDQETEEPCLVVIPRYQKQGFKPCVVALSAAYKYNDPRYLARVSWEFLSLLGFAQTPSEGHKVASLIHDHLGDLLTMPPNPTSVIVVADATIGTGLGKRSLEIVEYVPLQQS